jgi:hypothetical protein
MQFKWLAFSHEISFIADLVAAHFLQVRWDGAMSVKMIKELATVLGRLQDDDAMDLMQRLTSVPTLMAATEV